MDTKSMAMTPEEIALDSKIHINTIYFYLKNGVIPHVKLQRRYLVSRLEYEKWLSGQSTQPPAIS